MRVTLYMATTTNGMIAKPDDNTNFASAEDWASARKVYEETKAIIIGRRTYEIMLKDPDQFWPKCSWFVLTNKSLKSPFKNVTFLHTSPQETLKYIASKGFSKVCVSGGGQTNTSFIKEGLVDEIYLDVEPIIFGRGIPLFAPADFETKLELLEVKKLCPQTVQLHYKVTK